jgi:hypothetical protein
LADASLFDTEGECKKVHNVVSWSLFRDVCAVLLDHVTAPTLSTSLREEETLGHAAQQDKIQDKSKRQRSVWIALATAHLRYADTSRSLFPISWVFFDTCAYLRTGGGKVVDASPCLLPNPLKNKYRRLSDSGKKKRAEDHDKSSLAGKGITHMVCCERLLKSDRPEVERKLKAFNLATEGHEAVSLVTDQWITNCFRCRKLLPITDENLYSSVEEERPQTKKGDAQLRTFVSAPFPACKEQGDIDSPEWIVVKAVIDEEVDDDDNLLEYLKTIEITDGIRSWRASLSDYSQFRKEGKLKGECLMDTWESLPADVERRGTPWSCRVCDVLRFPWGATIRGLAPPVDECRWKLSGDRKEWQQDWGRLRGEVGKEDRYSPMCNST